MLVRDLLYKLLRIRRSPGFTLTAVIALAIGTIAMELADPQLRQHLLNAQLALTIANFQDLPAQPQNISRDKETSAALRNVSYTQDQLAAQTDETSYDLGAVSDAGYQMPENMTGQFSTQHQFSRRATIDTRSGIIPGQVTRVGPLVANTRWTPRIDVQVDSALPPGAVSRSTANAAIDLVDVRDAMYTLRPVPGSENSTLSSFIDANVRGATHVTVKVGRMTLNKIQILNLPGSEAVTRPQRKKPEGLTEAQ